MSLERSPDALLRDCALAMGLRADRPETLPFTPGDLTAGSENELQAAVIGRRDDVDLPRTILASNYLANIERRVSAGDTGRRPLRELRACLDDNPQGVWENSWARFPRRRLGLLASSVLDADLKAPPGTVPGSRRSDWRNFLPDGPEGDVRVPVSYLLKLALADAVSREAVPAPLRETGLGLLGHFISDNTSPETSSFHVVVPGRNRTAGQALAAETSRRFLFCQLLLQHANHSFGLAGTGQKAEVFFCPHPPVRQRRLGRLVSDAFYRELFMNPCLSGWEDGEAKHRYMSTCHQVLSRSRLNAMAKLREAGILTRNLMVVPDPSDISLANNGTHTSLGSLRLGAMAAQGGEEGRRMEKAAGDLAIKIAEHFLPLFPGVYSAAPYRFAFSDFHPERLLGFLPHELDFSHLRMLWRRWKKKAAINRCGVAFTPLGPEGLDRALERSLLLRGDLVPDVRLLDYPVALLGTDRSPALDGRPGNLERAKADLQELGVFDGRMSMYLPVRLREAARHGFSGFEWRQHSLFETFFGDFAAAVDLQALVCALAFKYLATGRISHAGFPDRPEDESERRQPFFCAAAGVDVFNVRIGTPNAFLRRVLERVEGARHSRRYAGLLHVRLDTYRLALLRVLREDAADLVEAMGLRETLDDAEDRIRDPRRRVHERLLAGIMDGTPARSPLSLEARDFNARAEGYYRRGLRARQVAEAVGLLRRDLLALGSVTVTDGPRPADCLSLLEACGGRVATDALTPAENAGLINAVLLLERADTAANALSARSAS